MYSPVTNKITSENYASLIVGNYMLQNVLTTYSNVSINRINSEYSIAYIPVENMTSSIIYEVGYEAIPKCYGLLTISSCKTFEATQLEEIPSNDLNGQDVLVGFVDTGIDYRNRAFKYANNTSRIVSIWDQTIDSVQKNPPGYFYGSEFKREEINRALGEENPLGLVPSMDNIGHGTVLASIAGGSYDELNNFVGVAPNVEFVVVKLKPAKKYLKEFFCLPEDSISYQEDDIMFGINYLVKVAQDLKRPIAICIGIGSSQGSYMGNGIFSDFLSNLGRIGNVAIIVAAGNEGNSGHHYLGEIDPSKGEFLDVELVVGNNETDFLLKFVGNAPNVFTMDLYAPTGEFVGHMPIYYIQNQTIELKSGYTTILADNTIEYALTGDQFITFRFKNPANGIWVFRVYGIGDMVSEFNMGLPIRNFISPRTFFENSNPDRTITTPGNEETILTVVAYHSMDESLYFYNSRGFALEKTTKPDIAAPGVDTWAPTSGNQYMWNTGTSVAAAHTTGMIARLLEWGLVRGNMISMPSAVIRSIITGGARRNPNISYPNSEWGFGILDINNAIELSRRQRPFVQSSFKY